MNSRIFNRLELTFWNIAIPILSRSRRTRRGKSVNKRSRSNETIIYLGVMLLSGSVLGLLTGILLGSIF